jgi:uncharacterized protein YqeY
MQEKIKELLKEAMKAGDDTAKMTYRGLLSAFMNELVSKMKKPQDQLTDEEVMTVIRREIKKRDDSIKQYTDAGRPELAESEIKERDILMKFLPAQLSVAEVEAKVKEILSKLAPLDATMSGKYIGMCIKELKDVANGDMVKAAVERIILSL